MRETVALFWAEVVLYVALQGLQWAESRENA
jgi:hypothetical protein